MSEAGADVTLEQGALRCTIARRGAELRSLADVATGEEYIWQRDARVWADSAPILFPVIGRLRRGSYLHDGRRYRLPLHGFARGREFDLANRSAHSATFALREDAATLAQYPFRFVLQVTFALEAHGLTVRYEVHNPADTPLLFSLGAHPGFALPGSLSDWSLLFSDDEASHCYRLDGDLLSSAAQPFAFAEGRRIGLSPTLFDDDALIFKQVRSRRVRLVHRGGATRLQVDTGGAPTLGVWARPNAPFICIEPWHGHDDDATVSGELRAKPGIVTLAAGATFCTDYAIGIAPHPG